MSDLTKLFEEWETELPELQPQEAEWPADVIEDNPEWVGPEYDIEVWEHADLMARELGYRDYEQWYWSYDGFGF